MQSIRGILTPLVTPLGQGGAPDLQSVHELVQFQIAGGVHGLWSMGTTGEFAAFTEDERAAVTNAVVEASAGRVPVIANASDAATRLAIRHGRRAQAVGADAIAATPPYYYPHTQDELLAHYRAIRDAVDLPLFIYNIPQTVRVRVELATAQALALEGTVAGIKDSQNDLEWFRQLVLFARRNSIPFSALAGTRYLIDAAVLVGADGAVPSIANAFPELAVRAFNSAAAGAWDDAAEAEARIIEIESRTGHIPNGSRNAAVIGLWKSLLADRGVIARPDLTLPLRSLGTDERAAVRDARSAVPA